MNSQPIPLHMSADVIASLRNAEAAVTAIPNSDLSLDVLQILIHMLKGVNSRSYASMVLARLPKFTHGSFQTTDRGKDPPALKNVHELMDMWSVLFREPDNCPVKTLKGKEAIHEALRLLLMNVLMVSSCIAGPW